MTGVIYVARCGRRDLIKHLKSTRYEQVTRGLCDSMLEHRAQLIIFAPPRAVNIIYIFYFIFFFEEFRFNAIEFCVFSCWARLSRAISRIRYRDAFAILDQRHIKNRIACVVSADFAVPKKAQFCGLVSGFQVASRIRPPELLTETNPRAVKSRAFFSADAAHVYLACIMRR